MVLVGKIANIAIPALSLDMLGNKFLFSKLKTVFLK